MTSDAHFFAGKTALVTGASRGIGREIAVSLAERGVNIILHYNKNHAAAEDTAAKIKSLGVAVMPVSADLCDTEQTTKMLEEIYARHKSLDFFIANAASTAFKPLAEISEAHVLKTFTLVITSFLLCVRTLLPIMKNRDARILTVSGIDTRRFCPGHGLLAAAKSALETLSKYLAVELAPEGIKVKCLNPGLVASDSTRFYLGAAFNDMMAKANAIAPSGGCAEPETVAKIALWLLTPPSDWIAAQTVVADGGLGFLLPGFS